MLAGPLELDGARGGKVKELTDSMPDRFQDVIDADGGPIGY